MMNQIHHWSDLASNPFRREFNPRMLSDSGYVVRQNCELKKRTQYLKRTQFVKYDRTFVVAIFCSLLLPYLNAGATKYDILQLVSEALNIITKTPES